MAPTVVLGPPPAGGDAHQTRGELVGGLGQAHGGHGLGEAGGRGQLQQGDVVVDGEYVELGVLEHLWGGVDSCGDGGLGGGRGGGPGTRVPQITSCGPRSQRSGPGPRCGPWTRCLLLRPVPMGCRGSWEQLGVFRPQPGLCTPEGLLFLGSPQGHHTLAIFSTWMLSASEPWSNSPATTWWVVLERAREGRGFLL